MSPAPKYLDVALRQELVDAIVTLVGEGRYPDRAAGELAVPKRVFDAWMEQGEADSVKGALSLERELYERLEIADAQAESMWFVMLRDRVEASKYFQGTMAFMSRRWPERWADRKPEHGGERRFEDEVRDLLREMTEREQTPAGSA